MSTRIVSIPFLFALLVLGLACQPAPLHAHGDVDDQIHALNHRIQHDPANPLLYLKRGELYRLLRHWDSAEADYARAEQLDPALCLVHLSRALMRLELDQSSAALSSIDLFLAANPASVQGHEARGKILVRLGRRLEAASEFSEAIRLDQDASPDIYLERADAFAEEGMQHLSDAIQALDQGIEKLGPVVSLELPALELELRRGNADAALKRLEILALNSPRPETWLVRRGELFLERGWSEEARREFDAALAAIESLPERHRTTAVTLKLEEAVRSGLEKIHAVTGKHQ